MEAAATLVAPVPAAITCPCRASLARAPLQPRLPVHVEAAGEGTQCRGCPWAVGDKQGAHLGAHREGKHRCVAVLHASTWQG